MPQAFYRRKLPHLQRDDKQHFVTFCTDHRWVLPERVRPIVLESCLHDNGIKFDLWVTVVMPDHVHLIFMPLVNGEAQELYSLATIMDAIKGSSAHKINKLLGRKGRVWQPESFDHVLRSSENLDAKIGYVMENPVRLGLVGMWSEYPWIWKRADVNPFAPASESFGESCWASPSWTGEGGCPYMSCSATLDGAHAGGCHLRVGMFSETAQGFPS